MPLDSFSGQSGGSTMTSSVWVSAGSSSGAAIARSAIPHVTSVQHGRSSVGATTRTSTCTHCEMTWWKTSGSGPRCVSTCAEIASINSTSPAEPSAGASSTWCRIRPLIPRSSVMGAEINATDRKSESPVRPGSVTGGARPGGREDRLDVRGLPADAADRDDHVEDLLEREVGADLPGALGGFEQRAAGGEYPRTVLVEDGSVPEADLSNSVATGCLLREKATKRCTHPIRSSVSAAATTASTSST